MLTTTVTLLSGHSGTTTSVLELLYIRPEQVSMEISTSKLSTLSTLNYLHYLHYLHLTIYIIYTFYTIYT